jgi:hypothetical protein
MARRLLLAAAALLATLLVGCATIPQQPVASNPNFDGIYRLSYSGTGSALYYRFYADGVVLSARSDAPFADIIAGLDLANSDASRGTWAAHNGELRVGIDEGTVWYDSRFDLRADGRIALRGLPRTFDFIPLDRGTLAARQ